MSSRMLHPELYSRFCLKRAAPLRRFLFSRWQQEAMVWSTPMFTSPAQQPFGNINREVFDFGQPPLSPLPAANGEARTVAGILGGKSVMLLGDAATESALKKQPLGQFRVLHFAVHGLVSTKFPERSALVLYPDPAGNEDGYWQAREIARTAIERRTRYIVLMRCWIGPGGWRGGSF